MTNIDIDSIKKQIDELTKEKENYEKGLNFIQTNYRATQYQLITTIGKIDGLKSLLEKEDPKEKKDDNVIESKDSI